jgi:hypothetical protein
MRKQYDFSKARRNPYAKDEATIAYFKELADDTGIPYQTLINLYLRDCAAHGRKLSMQWRKESQTGAA